MKIHTLSDIHLEFGGYTKDLPDADVLLLAGDICVADSLEERKNDAHSRSHKKAVKTFFNRMTQKYEKIFYIPGNHEHYNGSLQTTVEILQNFLPYKNLTIGERIIENYKGVLFLGTTLWTDFNEGSLLSLQACKYGMNDFKIIRDGDFTFSPDRAYVLHQEAKAWLRTNIDLNSGIPIVVMSHHCPSRMSIHPRFAHDMALNGGYSSNCEDLMKANVKLWQHGHTHHRFDYKIGETRIICNPRGYVEYEENTDFDPNLIIEI